VSGNYPFEQLIRAQRWQQRHADWDIKSVDGGSHFVAEQKVSHGAHIIADPSLKSLMDTLEERDAIKRAAEVK
jgi:hypothetical protein